MDISLKLKRIVASVSALALVVSFAPVAFAQTFSDVPTDAWYYNYVEQGVSQGVFQVADQFRPNDALNRAELVKIVIEATGGLAGFEAPATPTFTDVPADAWFYEYVEAAAQQGIVGGYTDASGQPTGKFGPADTVNRAAATKILVNAFQIPTTLTPASVFSDVKAGAWFYDFVVTAYNQSVLDGYANGNFGPADAVTRAQVAKLVQTSQNPVVRSTTPPPTASQGALEVSLNDNTPSSSTLPLSATSVSLLSFDLTAAEDDVTATSLVVTRGGVGQVTDWDNLYIYDGAKRLTTGRTLNSDTNTATFPVSVVVKAGTTKTLRLVGDVAASGTAQANNQHYFYLSSASAVASNGQSTTGDFPVAGNTFTIGSVSVETVTLTKGSTPSQPQIGAKDAEVAAFKLQAGGSNDVAVHQVTLTNGGSLSNDKLKNLKLLQSTTVVATTASMDGDRVTFVLSTPYVIPKGQTRNFYVRSDIDGGRSSDTIKFYLDENTDLVAIDQQYGFGTKVTNSTFASGSADTITLKGGKVTVTDNGPASTQVSSNSTNLKLLDYSLTVDRDVVVKNTDVTITVTDGTNTPDWDSSNTATLSATRLKYDAQTGNFTVGQVVTGGTSGATGTIAADSDAGTTGTLLLTGVTGSFQDNETITDPVTGSATANGTLVSSVTTGTTNQYDLVTTAHNGNLEAGDMIQIGSSTYARVVSNDLSTNDGGLVVYSTSDLSTLSTGTITEVNVYAYIKNVKIVDLDSGATQAGPLTLASQGTEQGSGTNTTYKKTFNEDYNLAADETRHLSIQFDTDINLVAGYKVKATVDYSTATYLKDVNANEDISSADLVGSPLGGKEMTVAVNSLTVALASTPVSQTFVKGENNVPALGVALTAGDASAITVKKIEVRAYADTTGTTSFSATGDTAANTIVSTVTLYDGNDVVAGPETFTGVLTNGASTTAFNGDSGDHYKAVFDNLNIQVAEGSTKTLVAKVKLLTTGTGFLALDVVPSSDVVAEDRDANTVTASGSALNGTANAHSPELSVISSGTLSASSEGNPNANVMIAGKTAQLASKYRFNALKEAFTVNKLTVVNDTTGDGDFDPADLSSTGSVAVVTISYPDINGVTQTKSSSLTGGSATFSSLGLYVPKDGDAFVEVKVDVNSMTNVGESLSGQSFRLGVQDTTNTISTFEAVGGSSSTTVTSPTISNSASVNTFVVRKTKPTFAKVEGLSTTLTDATMDLYSFTATADSAGSLSFGRIIFDVTTSGLQSATTETLNAMRLLRNGQVMDTGDVNIYVTNSAGANATEAQAGAGFDAADGAAGGGIANGTYKVIVSFDIEESINAGSTNTYTLRGTVSGSTQNDTIVTRIAQGDEDTQLTGLTAATNANTGRVYVAADATAGIFTAAATDFSQLLGTNRNIIWSDKSTTSVAHTYPTVAAGTVTTATGSFDYTNGFRLGTTSMNSHTLAKP